MIISILSLNFCVRFAMFFRLYRLIFDLLKLRFGFYYPFCQVDCMRICKQNLPLFKILSIRFNPVILIMVNTLFKIKQALYFSIVTLSHFKKSHYFMSNYRQKPIIFVSMKKFFEKLN